MQNSLVIFRSVSIWGCLPCPGKAQSLLWCWWLQPSEHFPPGSQMHHVPTCRNWCRWWPSLRTHSEHKLDRESMKKLKTRQSSRIFSITFIAFGRLSVQYSLYLSHLCNWAKDGNGLAQGQQQIWTHNLLLNSTTSLSLSYHFQNAATHFIENN